MNIYGLDYNVDLLWVRCATITLLVFFINNLDCRVIVRGVSWQLLTMAPASLFYSSKVFRHIAEQHWQFACKRNLKWLS